MAWGEGRDLAFKSLQPFCFFLVVLFQIQTRVIKASGGVQPHDTWRSSKIYPRQSIPAWGAAQDL